MTTQNIEVTRDAKSMPLAPIDTSIPLPPSIAAAAARAEQLHAAAYQTSASAPTNVDLPVVEPVVPPVVPPVDASANPPPAPPPAPVVDEDGDVEDGLTAAQWKHKYVSMQGRLTSAKRTIGSMQEQMTAIGDELVRTQELNQRLQTAAPVQPQQRPATTKLVTADEETNYGADLIDVVKRAAREEIAPELDAVKTENQQLKRRMQQGSQAATVQALASAVPNWEEINVDPKFIAWLRLPDIYSGRVRMAMLNQAFEAANAARVIAFFEGYLNEAAATGSLPSPTPPPAAASAPAPRAPAVPLVTLASPGRAKPASGDQLGSAPVDKPVFTHAQIKDFYRAVRRGEYVGREADKDKLERQIFAAQNDGRIR